MSVPSGSSSGGDTPTVASGGQTSATSSSFAVSSLAGLTAVATTVSVMTPATTGSSVGLNVTNAVPSLISAGLGGNAGTLTGGVTFLGTTGGGFPGTTGAGRLPGAGVAAVAPAASAASSFATSPWGTAPSLPSLGSPAFASSLAGASVHAAPMMGPHFASTGWYGMKMENKPPVMQGSFDLYAEELKTFLTNMDIWGVVENASAVRAAVSEEEFRRTNNLARGAIWRGVPKADAELICHQQSAQDMWTAFVDKQTKREYANYIFARQRLIANAYTPGENMNYWLREMQLYRNELLHYRRGVSDEVAKILLGNVVQTHRDVVRQFSKHFDPGYQRPTPSSAQVMNALRAESELDARMDEPQQARDIPSAQGGKKQGQQPQGKGKTRGRGRYKAKSGNPKQVGKKPDGEDKRECWDCHQVGHIHTNCPNPKRDDDESDSQHPERKRWQNKKKAGKNGEKRHVNMLFRCDDISAPTATQSSLDGGVEWILDSASDCHVCTNKDMLTDLRQDDGPMVFDWEGKLSKSRGLIGEVDVRVKNANQPGIPVSFCLGNVLYTASGTNNLLSLRRMDGTSSS
ncbi:unnamed protein product [Phytophthora fragariaefolia]|uniref:Unnamed protein product n=1 Tax=Phytophthora fragariaefolia TaxID=1490495 RepID=A0A9W6X5K5_9STRA|nr:unnamed protein product [Phytophthora fragariaefolia]